MKLFCECATYNRAVLVGKERFLLDISQYVFRIHVQEALSFDGKIREFTLRVVGIAHTAEIVCSSDPLYPWDGRNAILVGVRQAVKPTDIIACNQPGCGLFEGPMQRRHECLQRAEEENAHGYGGRCTRAPNPVLPQVFQDKGYPFHG